MDYHTCKGKGKAGGKPCRKQICQPKQYCSKHTLTARPTPSDFDLIGLIPDTWDYITRYLTIEQIRSLYLTCKTLHWHFLDCFVRNPRYVMIVGKLSFVNMTYQDIISQEYKTRYDCDIGSILPCFRGEVIGGHGSKIVSQTKLRPALFVINSHLKARQMFMRIRVFKKENIGNAYVFDCIAENLEQRMFEYARNNICKRISRSFLRFYTLQFKISEINICKIMADEVIQCLNDVYDTISYLIKPDNSTIIYKLDNFDQFIPQKSFGLSTGSIFLMIANGKQDF